jgi:hypothetical protein
VFGEAVACRLVDRRQEQPGAAKLPGRACGVALGFALVHDRVVEVVQMQEEVQALADKAPLPDVGVGQLTVLLQHVRSRAVLQVALDVPQ